MKYTRVNTALQLLHKTSESDHNKREAEKMKKEAELLKEDIRQMKKEKVEERKKVLERSRIDIDIFCTISFDEYRICITVFSGSIDRR